MASRGKKRSRKTPLVVAALLLILAAMFPLGDFFAGILWGGGRRQADDLSETERKPGTLEITVLSARTGKPVSGARILVSGLEGDPQNAVSGPGGRATLENLGRGPVRIEVSHGGETAMAWADPAKGGHLELTVVQEKARRGQVRFAGGRTAPVTVRLMDADGEELARVQTGPDGRYELAEKPGARSICIEAPHSAPAVAEDGDIDLDGGEEIAGRLLGAGAGTLEVFGRAPQPDDDAMLPFRCVWKVASDGSFSGRLPKGVRAWGRYAGLPLELKPGALALPKPVTATGIVRRADGTGAARAELLFGPLLGADFPVPLPPVRVIANEAGRFTVPGFAQGRYAVEVRANGCATRIVSDVKPGAEPLEFKLAPGFSLAGRIVDAGGLPVPSAEVRAVSLPDESGEFPVARARADIAGVFVLKGMGGEYARIQVTAAGHHPTTLDGVRPGAGLKIILQKR